MKRPRRQAAGLLDLPAEVLEIILSFLGPLSLAAVRLACRALRDAAARGRGGRVVIRSELWQGDPCVYIATACASPRVLRQLHTFQALMERLVEEQEDGSANLAARPDQAAYEHTMTFLQTQLLASIAGEVVSLTIGPEGIAVEDYRLADWLALDPSGAQLLRRLHGLLPRMRQLESLHLEAPLHRAVLQELPALRHLTSVKLGRHCSEADIQGVCDTLALSRLELDLGGMDDGDAFDYQSVLAVLASGKMSGLQELVLPFPAAEMQHLSGLSVLTALTSLSVRAGSTPAELTGLPSISGLKSLCVEAQHFVEDIDTADISLSPLTALTRLTLLDLVNDHGSGLEEWYPPSDVSVLSALTALRVLRCSLFADAEAVAGDPLPVQLRFLRTAPALEVLDLGFSASFWSLSDASVHAVQEAVRGLLSVKQISVLISDELELYHLPLRAFAAASSIETLSFRADGPYLDGPESSAAQARDCFKALTKLRSLELSNNLRRKRVPHYADLLAGLPSTHLTPLVLSVRAPNPALVQEIARFRDLQSLVLASGIDNWLPSLGDLSGLNCLTRLEVEDLGQEYLETPDPHCRCPQGPAMCSPGGHVSQAPRLDTVIREYGRLVGFPVQTRIEHF